MIFERQHSRKTSGDATGDLLESSHQKRQPWFKERSQILESKNEGEEGDPKLNEERARGGCCQVDSPSKRSHGHYK
jgi:hypothetical protein